MADPNMQGWDPLNALLLGQLGPEQKLNAFVLVDGVTGYAKNPAGDFKASAKYTNIKFFEMVSEAHWDNACGSPELVKFHGIRVIIEDGPMWGQLQMAALRCDKTKKVTVVFSNASGSDNYIKVDLEQGASAENMVRVSRARTVLMPNGKWGIDVTFTGPKLTLNYSKTPEVFDFTKEADSKPKDIQKGPDKRIEA